MPLAHTTLSETRLYSALSLTSLGPDKLLATYVVTSPGANGTAGSASVTGRILSPASGTPAGSQFAISPATQNPGSSAFAETAADGSVLVGWTTESPGVLHAQRLGADGQRLGSDITLAATTFQSIGPGALDLPNGKYFITWRDHAGGVTYGGLYDTAGTALGTPLAYQAGGAFAVDGARFASVRYQSNDTFTGYTGWLQYFSTDTGAPVGGEIRLGETLQGATTVALGDGRLLQYYDVRSANPEDRWELEARFLDLQGAPLGNAFQVNTSTPGLQSRLAAQVLEGGRFALAWTTDAPDGMAGEVKAQLFNADGSKFGGEILVDPVSFGRAGNKTYFVTASTEALAGGGFAIAWNAGDGVFASAYDRLGTIATTTAQVQATVTGTAGADTLAAADGVRTRFVSHGGADQITGSRNVDTVVLDTTYADLQRLGLRNEGGVISFTPTPASSASASLKGVERIELKDTVLAYDTALPRFGAGDGGHVGQAYTLFSALMDRSPDRHELSVWTRKADELGDYGALAQNMVDTLKPGMDTATLVRQVGSNLVGEPVGDAFVAEFSAMVGAGKPFATQGALIAAAAALPLATDPLVALVGSLQQLSVDVFA
jgi:hypothetical protein